MKPLFFILILLIVSFPATGQTNNPPIYVTLWFDTEDYILPQSDDAAKRLAELLTRLGVKATFKIVGEKARVLEQRGRRDVIAALNRHEIGYHADTHSGQPTIAVYLQHTGWEDGAAEFHRRESPGVRDIQRIFGVTPTCYGQPGAAWASQTYPALRQMGIGMYLDEGNHVGLDDQPFYYGGMLNVFKMRSTVARMELKGGESFNEGKATFTAAYEKLRTAGGGTISIYYHPCEWVHQEFWDGVNFRRGANPPRSQWKLPPVRPVAETETAFQDFERYVTFIQSQPGVRFVTAADLIRLYADRALTRAFSPAELLAAARAVRREITFQKFDGFALSGADVFSLLTGAMVSYLDHNALPAATRLTAIYGPARSFASSAGGTKSSAFAWPAFAAAVRDVAAFARRHNRMPDEIWIGAESISPKDYLATLAGAIEELIASGKPPAEVRLQTAAFTGDRHVAEDSDRLWGWVIFPEGFRAPKIVELARLQAWTLKPAIVVK
jgi:Polysaccharide deacetylase